MEWIRSSNGTSPTPGGRLAALRRARDLLLQATELHRQFRARAATDGQLPLGGELVTPEPSGLPEMASRDQVNAELDTLRAPAFNSVDHHAGAGSRRRSQCAEPERREPPRVRGEQRMPRDP
ncbi:hypothetical protein [Streptomyces sp. R41]|uniref:Uncharacterized protein n=1 Tax=Streptomyces sp. R41 TaxID=3238632 RepID=A0AB39RMK1_9ACTN